MGISASGIFAAKLNGIAVKMIKKIALLSLGLLSVNVFAGVNYDKTQLVKKVNEIIKEVKVLNNFQSPENCLWHISESYSHIKTARKSIFDNDLLTVESNFYIASQSIKDLIYEGDECRSLSIHSHKAYDLISDAIQYINLKG